MLNAGEWLRLAYTTVIIAFLLYLLSPGSFFRLLWFLVLYVAIDISITIYVRSERRRRSQIAVQDYLKEMDENIEKFILNNLSAETEPVFERMSRALQESTREIQSLKEEAVEERRLLERWVHEVKTPLALFLLLLENEKDQLDLETYTELHRLRLELEIQVMQILYYGKIDAAHPDERFERMSMRRIMNDVLDTLRYEALLREVQFELEIKNSSDDFDVLTDPRLLQLVLTQILNNALKYSPTGGTIRITAGDLRLSIQDEGAGVRPEDLPFLFDRAFSGVHPNRSTSTGLGLYLANFYAKRLGIKLTVDPVSTQGKGFLIHLDFPALDSPRLSERFGDAELRP